ncbi:hypothetical protein MMC11_007269 [Xylographa trunciseda]|nr:hypothetical protein [Xylographa trunciseda]
MIPLAEGETLFVAFEDTDTPQVSYGLPFARACKVHAEKSTALHASRIFIIASASLSQNTNALTDLQSTLGDRVVGTRIGMKPHTLWSDILQIVKEVSAADADCLVTLGAGSLTDGAKIIALAVANKVTTFDDLAALPNDSPTRKAHVVSPNIPVVSIPTSLSGGEYSAFAGGTNDHTHRKHSFAAPNKGPALVILDATLSKTTPASIWLSTGIRAVDHCVEALCSLQGNPAADKAAKKGLTLLVPGLLRSKLDGEDVEARHNCQLGVIEAMRTVRLGVPLGASHGIGHQLGPLGVGHGETSCILLPAVCKYNAKHRANLHQQEKALDILLEIPEVRKALDSAHLATPDADLGGVLDVVIRELGMPRSLKDVGVGREKLDGLAENSLHDRWCVTNPVPLERKGQVLEILEMVVE